MNFVFINFYIEYANLGFLDSFRSENLVTQ